MLVNLYATVRALPALTFAHALRGQRDRSDPELVPHLEGFMGFVMDRGRRPMNATRYAILRHLERVQHHLSIELDEASLAALTAWATSANAIAFLADARVCAPDGAVLVDPATGEAEPDARVPYPSDAVRRKASTDQRLRGAGVAVLASLPPVISELEVSWRTPSEIGARCAALFACALRAESLSSGQPIPAREIVARMPHVLGAMSPRERSFFEAAEPAPEDVTDHVWRYEALLALAWSLRLVPDLPYPNSLCDVGALAQTMISLDPATLSRGPMRPGTEILDALDLTYRLHWACTDARVNAGPAPRETEPGVVFERHHAFAWLTRDGDADWDDVQTAT